MKCIGYHHQIGKFAGEPFPCCARCKHFSKNGQPAPDLLKEWISGICPKEERKS